MTDDQRHEASDDAIARLLELADGPRDLPPGEEERLLAAILVTAADAGAGTDTTELADVVIVTGLDVTGDRTDRHAARPRRTARWAAAATAAAAAAAAVAAVALPQLRASTDVPEVAGVEEAVVAGLDRSALCDRGRALVAELGLDDPAQRRTTGAAALRELALVVDELAAGRDDVGAADAAIRARSQLVTATLRLQAQQLDDDDVGPATRTRTRTIELLAEDPPLLDALGCPP